MVIQTHFGMAQSTSNYKFCVLTERAVAQMIQDDFVLKTSSVISTFISPTANPTFAREVSNAGLQCQSPTDICKTCLEANPRAIWLTWLKCIHPEEHRHCLRVTVVVSLSHRQLVKVRQPSPSLLRLHVKGPQLCRFYQQGCRQDSCVSAHSPEELNYWKWKIAEEQYKDLV